MNDITETLNEYNFAVVFCMTYTDSATIHHTTLYKKQPTEDDIENLYMEIESQPEKFDNIIQLLDKLEIFVLDMEAFKKYILPSIVVDNVNIIPGNRVHRVQ